MQPGDVFTLVDLIPTRLSWMAEAACRSRSDLNLVPNTESTTATAAALELCAACPAKGPCLAHALDDDSLLGVWGGTTSGERRAMRREAS